MRNLARLAHCDLCAKRTSTPRGRVHRGGVSTERACPPRGLTERCEPSEATEGLWALGMTFGFKIGVSRIFKLHYFLDCNSEAARVKKKNPSAVGNLWHISTRNLP